LDGLDAAVRAQILRRLEWLGTNAGQMIHRRLQNMPPDLGGLCKLRHSDFRILYWPDASTDTINVYRVEHRSTIYRDL